MRGHEAGSDGRVAERPKVIVVGGGISGCACAARLAWHGVHVTVVSSALDVVGLPGYGPDLRADSERWTGIAETLSLLPEGLKWAWINCGYVLESGEAVLIVDRRAVSIESKRALEKMPGLEFRQGLVTNIRCAGSRTGTCGTACESAAQTAAGTARSDRTADGTTNGASSECLAGTTDGGAAGPAAGADAEHAGDPADGILIEVETAFGEVFSADAVVLAPGLSFHGEVEIGSEVLPGGRYGEVPANELCQALKALGVAFEETTVVVGPRYAHDSYSAGISSANSEPGVLERARLSRRRLVRARSAIAAVLGQAASDGRDLREGINALRSCVLEEGDVPMSPVAPTGSSDEEAWEWPEENPPAPYWNEDLQPRVAVVLDGRVRRCGVADPGGSKRPCLIVAPDGVATGEYYEEPYSAAIVDPGVAAAGANPSFRITRPGHRVRAMIAAGVDSEGRLGLDTDRIRVAGRAAGAGSYLESLRSGVAVADSLVGSLRRGGR